MPFAEWSKRYEVRIRILDEQHQRLFCDLNDLHTAVTSGCSPKDIVKRLGGFVDDVKQHFATEEQLLKDAGYPGYEKQRSDHAALLKEIEGVLSPVRGGEAALSVERLESMRDPLVGHICGPDSAYAEFLKDQGIR